MRHDTGPMHLLIILLLTTSNGLPHTVDRKPAQTLEARWQATVSPNKPA